MLRYSADGEARDPFNIIYKSKEWLFPYQYKAPGSFPLIFTVEPTNNCNLDCLYCARQMMTRRKGFMSLETMEKLSQEAGAQSTPVGFRFGGMGEPFIHPKFVELVRIAKRHNVLCLTFTNGRFVTEDKIEQLVDAGLDEIRFSSSGITSEEHEQVRVRSDYERDFLGLIQTVRRIRDRSPARKPYLSVLTNVLLKDRRDSEEASRYADFLLQWVDKVAIDLTDYNHVRKIERVRPHYEACQIEREYRPCVELLLRKAVWWDGTVICCDTYWDDKEDSMVLGNLNNGDTITELVRSEKMQRILGNVGKIGSTRQGYPVCQDCFSTTDRYDALKDDLRREAVGTREGVGTIGSS